MEYGLWSDRFDRQLTSLGPRSLIHVLQPLSQLSRLPYSLNTTSANLVALSFLSRLKTFIHVLAAQVASDIVRVDADDSSRCRIVDAFIANKGSSELKGDGECHNNRAEEFHIGSRSKGSM